jgi:hypothetical protein
VSGGISLKKRPDNTSTMNRFHQALELIKKAARHYQGSDAQPPFAMALATARFDVCDAATPLPVADLVGIGVLAPTSVFADTNAHMSSHAFTSTFLFCLYHPGYCCGFVVRYRLGSWDRTAHR